MKHTLTQLEKLPKTMMTSE